MVTEALLGRETLSPFLETPRTCFPSKNEPGFVCDECTFWGVLPAMERGYLRHVPVVLSPIYA